MLQVIDDMDYSLKVNPVTENKAYKYRLYRANNQLSYEAFLDLLKQQKAFRQFFIDLLTDIPFRAYHWETPPATQHSLDQSFEFTVTRAPAIDLPPDPSPFLQYFQPGKQVVLFENLGGDAKLIAPTPSNQQLNYSHIGVFTKNAPEEQQLAFWQMVGKVTKKLISDHTIWLNTAGGGVAWLHVRLDSQPKYYRHHPYTVTR